MLRKALGSLLSEKLHGSANSQPASQGLGGQSTKSPLEHTVQQLADNQLICNRKWNMHIIINSVHQLAMACSIQDSSRLWFNLVYYWQLYEYDLLLHQGTRITIDGKQPDVIMVLITLLCRVLLPTIFWRTFTKSLFQL